MHSMLEQYSDETNNFKNKRLHVVAALIKFGVARRGRGTRMLERHIEVNLSRKLRWKLTRFIYKCGGVTHIESGRSY